MNNYQPVFLDNDISIKKRWENLEYFTEQWYETKIHKEDFTQEITEIEKRFNFLLPQSAKYFLTFAKRLENMHITYPNGCESNLFNETLRDCVEIKMYEEFDILSLLIQAEGDIIWGIRKIDFKKENPEIFCFLLNYDTDSFEAYPDENKPSVTSFILNHLISYLGNCNSFNIPSKSVEEFAQISKKYFGNYKTYDDITLAEDTNILIHKYQHFGEPLTGFNIRTNNTLDKLPSEIVYFLKNTYTPWVKLNNKEAENIWLEKF